jgi:replicative DNA helicase
MSSGINIKNDLTRKFRKDVIPMIKFFPKYSITSLDIRNIIHDIENTYGKNSVRVLYLDYLDLLKSDIKTDIYRLELGYISSALKDIGVEFNIPVITPSQLNKSIFENQASSFNLGMISESMKKVDVSDFIAMMLKDRTEDIIHMRIGKNRSGPSEISVDLKVNFPCYKIENAYRVSAMAPGQTRDSMSDPTKFSGVYKIDEKTNIKSNMISNKNSI